MVFDLGDRVTGWGRFVADADGEWLDLARVVAARLTDRPLPRSGHSVRLVGADFDAPLAVVEGSDAIPGRLVVTGTWLGDAIEVESWSPAGPMPWTRANWTNPPCPSPAGGWPRGEPNSNLDFQMGDLQTSGLAVTVVIFRPGVDQAVLVVAASNVEAVEAV